MKNIQIVTVNSYHKNLVANVKVGRKTVQKNVGRLTRIVTSDPADSRYTFNPRYTSDFDADTLRSIAQELESVNKSYRKNVVRKRLDDQIAELESLRKAL